MISGLPQELQQPILQQQSANAAQNPLAGVVVPPTASGSPQPQSGDVPAPQAQSAGQDALGSQDVSDKYRPIRWGAFASALGKATDAIPVDNSQPGAWAKRLVGGAQSVLAGFGDASTSPVTPGGSGVIEGLSQTIQNRNNRVRQQRQDAMESQKADDAHKAALTEDDYKKILTSKANIELKDQQLLSYQMGQDYVDKQIQQGKDIQNRLINAPTGPRGTITQEGLTGEEITNLVKTNKLNPTYQTSFPAGKAMVGVDKNTGLPQYATTYDVVDLPLTYMLSHDDIQEFKRNGVSGFETVDPNKPITVNGAQANYLFQQSMNNQTQRDLVQQQQNAAKINLNKQQHELASSNLGPEWTAASTSALGQNPQEAYNMLAQSNPEWASTHSFKDVMDNYGGQEAFFKVVENIKGKDFLGKIEKDPTAEFTGEKGPATLGILQNYIKRPDITPNQRLRATQLIEYGNAAIASSRLSKKNEEADKEAITSGDPNVLGDLLETGLASTVEMMSTRKPEVVGAAIKRAAELRQQRHPNGTPYNASVQDAWYAQAKSPTNIPFFGSAKTLTRPGGDLDTALQAHQHLGTGKFPDLNSLEQYLAYHDGDPNVESMLGTVLPLTDNYAKVMSGTGGSDAATRFSLLKAFAGVTNDQQYQALIDATRKAVNNQVEGRLGSNYIMRQAFAPETMPRTITAPDGKTQFHFKNEEDYNKFLQSVQKAQGGQPNPK